jgi:multiple sugar transport system substrate-binding protein
VALIGGPQYDVLYERLPAFEADTGYSVEPVCRLPHPELNAFVADAYADGRRPSIDLISTHIKYAPSQADFLFPLDEHLAAGEVAAFLPAAIDASHVDGQLLQLPRMVDARLLFYRSDRLAARQLGVPTSWDELGRQARALNDSPHVAGYVFPGRHSGLFGTFFELVVMAGGRLFDGTGSPVFDREPVEWALEYLRAMYGDGVTPRELPDWHYDEVSECFRSGCAAFAADWPAFFALYLNPATSAVTDRFGVARYPLGPAGRRAVYSGMHSFAVPVTTRDVSASLALLRFLLDEESQWLEARHGAFPTRLTTLQRLEGSLDPHSLAARRLSLLRRTVEEDLLMFPKLPRYPLIEDGLWPVVQDAVTGRMGVAEAATRMPEMARTILL